MLHPKNPRGAPKASVTKHTDSTRVLQSSPVLCSGRPHEVLRRSSPKYDVWKVISVVQVQDLQDAHQIPDGR